MENAAIRVGPFLIASCSLPGGSDIWLHGKEIEQRDAWAAGNGGFFIIPAVPLLPRRPDQDASSGTAQGV